MKFHHLGIATDNIPAMQNKLKKLFNIKATSEIIFDPEQNASLCMITTNEGFNIELISGEIVANILKKRQYLYHTCYSTLAIDETITTLVNEGALLVSEPKPAILFDNRKVAFLMTDLGLIELVEEERIR